MMFSDKDLAQNLGRKPNLISQTPMIAWLAPASCWAATKSLVDNPYSIHHTILSADCLAQFSGAFAYGLICDRDTDRVGQSVGSQTFARDWGWTSAQCLDPSCPKRLII